MGHRQLDFFIDPRHVYPDIFMWFLIFTVFGLFIDILSYLFTLFLNMFFGHILIHSSMTLFINLAFGFFPR